MGLDALAMVATAEAENLAADGADKPLETAGAAKSRGKSVAEKSADKPESPKSPPVKDEPAKPPAETEAAASEKSEQKKTETDEARAPAAGEAAEESAAAGAAKALAPGFRFYPTDEELVSFYLKRKVLKKAVRFAAIAEVDIYKHEPWELADHAILKSRDQEWYFFSALDKKYSNGARRNRATGTGYWKATGKDREIRREEQVLGMKKTLVFHSGRAPDGVRTNWVMHEYRLVDPEQEKDGDTQAETYTFVLCRVFHKSNIGPPNGNRYAPFKEEDWDDDSMTFIPGVETKDYPVAAEDADRGKANAKVKDNTVAAEDAGRGKTNAKAKDDAVAAEDAGHGKNIAKARDFPVAAEDYDCGRTIAKARGDPVAAKDADHGKNITKARDDPVAAKGADRGKTVAKAKDDPVAAEDAGHGKTMVKARDVPVAAEDADRGKTIVRAREDPVADEDADRGKTIAKARDDPVAAEDADRGKTIAKETRTVSREPININELPKEAVIENEVVKDVSRNGKSPVLVENMLTPSKRAAGGSSSPGLLQRESPLSPLHKKIRIDEQGSSKNNLTQSNHDARIMTPPAANSVLAPFNFSRIAPSRPFEFLRMPHHFSSYDPTWPPHCMKLINDYQRNLHQTMAEMKELRLGLIAAESVGSILKSRFDALWKENEELKRIQAQVHNILKENEELKRFKAQVEAVQKNNKFLNSLRSRPELIRSEKEASGSGVKSQGEAGESGKKVSVSDKSSE